MNIDIGDIYRIYKGSDGAITKMFYDELQTLGPKGVVAVNLFRALKASERAKQYRGGDGNRSFRSMAYEKKSWSISVLSGILEVHATSMRLIWGWGIDDFLRKRDDPHHHVLYVELPNGQVSFHNGQRHGGPMFMGKWDGARGQGPGRICNWIASILKEHENAAFGAVR